MAGLRWTSSALILGCAVTYFVHAQAKPQPASVVGTWHLLRIESTGLDGQPSNEQHPEGLLIYTADGHASVQLMYAEETLSNEFVHDGYEATFGTYDLDAVKHQLVYHVQASATREALVGKSETLRYELPDKRHMVIKPTLADQHWSVVWERY